MNQRDLAVQQWLEPASTLFPDRPLSILDCLFTGTENDTVAALLDQVLAKSGESLRERFPVDFPDILTLGGVQETDSFRPIRELSAAVRGLRNAIVERRRQIPEPDVLSIYRYGYYVTRDLCEAIERFESEHASPNAAVGYLLFLRCLLTSNAESVRSTLSGLRATADDWAARALRIGRLDPPASVVNAIDKNPHLRNRLNELNEALWAGNTGTLRAFRDFVLLCRDLENNAGDAGGSSNE